MEESKIPDDFSSNFIINDLLQIHYLLVKNENIPNDNILQLSQKSLIVKNLRKLAIIESKNYDLSVTYINEGKNMGKINYTEYFTLIESIIEKLY